MPVILKSIFYLLVHYKYFFIFPLAILEGPILAIITGLLVSSGHLNFILAYSIIVAGDVTGDSIYYLLGRYSDKPFINKMMKRLGLTQSRLNGAKNYAATNPFKIISLSKIILGAGIAGLFVAGRSQLPYSKFISCCVITSLAMTALYLFVGYFFGEAYNTIFHYLNGFAAFTIIAFIAIALVLFAKSKMRIKT